MEIFISKKKIIYRMIRAKLFVTSGFIFKDLFFSL